MAIAPTGGIYKTLTFDGVSSREFGVYITGEAVFNAPQREVEMISIPGRNGQFALDKGRFENIEVSYPAGIFADSETDFAEAISNFRNFLCSRQGYVRLTDEYNPNEYRMAVYISGLEVTPSLLKAGQFTITFNCKPQRWLTSGETEIEVDSGDTLTNPTPFEAQPLLKAKGTGSIFIGSKEIELSNPDFGDVELIPRGASAGWIPFNKTNFDLLNSEDTITIQSGSIFPIGIELRSSSAQITGFTLSVGDSDFTCHLSNSYTVDAPYKWYFLLTIDEPITFTKTELSTKYIRFSASVTYTASGVSQSYSGWITGYIKESYRNSYYGLDFILCDSLSPISGSIDVYSPDSAVDRNAVTGYSTKSIAGDEYVYIDCELGEAYIFNEGEPVLLNRYIDLGSDLPVLASGSNVITFDNTVSDLKVKPNWWKV